MRFMNIRQLRRGIFIVVGGATAGDATLLNEYAADGSSS